MENDTATAASTFVLIHGGGDTAWAWHRVVPELRALGHDVVAPDLPAGDERATLDDYADRVSAAIGERRRVVVVGHSLGGITAALVAARRPVDALVFVAGMIPAPGETGSDWWRNTGYNEAVQEQAARDGGVTGNDDPYVSFFHDVPREVADEAMRRQSDHPSEAAMLQPWPHPALPRVPMHFVLCTLDRFFPAQFLRTLVRERLRITPDEIAAGHCVPLSRPKELAAMLDGYARRARRG